MHDPAPNRRTGVLENVGNPTRDGAVVGRMSVAPRPPSAPNTAETDADELVRALHRQISEVRSSVEAHRETMLAAGLTTAPAEPASFAPSDETPDEAPDER